ncbi:MAG TPA: hypothetical protein VM434_05045 [Beijerinckiaceae bacterium]|nr:hypothetical protein [Beijerinckiaceae bacterium]
MSRRAAAWMRGMIVLASLVALVLVAALAPARAHHTELHTWLLSWIPHECCVTADWCREIAPDDIVDLGGDRFQIVSTDQVAVRTGYSPDGGYWACSQPEFTEEGGHAGRWVSKSKVNCLFTPMPSVRLRPKAVAG